ncbi:hypothetical protein AOZ06_24100 [Kibdelosporangium phytohabitans]|uniref:Uncharacterized protein n=1 Tax=Kibdelosporangium phytohabitans TaxID=860235 RepID=A0A0N9II10_9PSEU|nr:hypothetical protein AOZ06_24100 [Kibdelosporangium phytohabitans]
MESLSAGDPLATAVVSAIHTGHVDTLARLLAEHPGLARTRLRNDSSGEQRTLLHIVTDWPGHFPQGPATVAALVAAGADVNARFGGGAHTETPLHWAASCDDVAVLDALLDAGAEIDADGAVIAGGTPLDDATAFAQWNAARRLVERGADVTMFQAAALGLLDRLEQFLEPATQEDVDEAFWAACHGGQQRAAEVLLSRGARINWIPPWENLTPLDAAHRTGADDLVQWLRDQGGTSA